MPVEPLSRLAERLWWFTTGGDPAPLLEDVAVDESQEVLQAALRTGPGGTEVVDREAVALLALVHWYRYTALPKGRCEGDYLHSRSLAQAAGFDDPSKITVGLQVRGEVIGLGTVQAVAGWARHVVARFDASGDQEALDSTADHLRARIAVLPDPRLLDAFVALLYRQFLARPDRLWLLEEAVAAARRVLALTAEDDPLRDARTFAFGAVLDARTRISPPAEAVESLRALVSRTADDDPALPGYLLALSRGLTLTDADETYAVLSRAMEVSPDPGLELLVRYVGVLPSHAPEKVLDVRRAIVDRIPADHPERPMHLVALADVARMAGHQDEAIDILRSVNVEGPWRARSLAALSIALGARFADRGDVADLHAAVVHAREAESLGDDLTSQATLGLALLRRFEHLRGQADLVEAKRHLREVTARAPEDYPGRSTWLWNLAAALSFEGQESADEAVELHRAALPGAVVRADGLSGLAVALIRRGGPGDQDEAVALLREAVEAGPTAVRLCNLGEALRVNAGRRDDPALLNEAVLVQREALDRCPAGVPERAWVLSGLASALLDRFARTHHPRDRGDAVSALRAAVEHEPAPPAERSGSAMRLGHLGAEIGDAEAALAGFGGVVDLLPHLATEDLLGDWQSLGNDAAAWALSAGRPDRALELVERSRLLLPGGGEVSLEVGERTVVVVNVSRYRCDALLAGPAGVRVVPLPELDSAEVTARAHVFLGAQARLESRSLPLPEKATLVGQVRETLDWLWRTVAAPVLDALDPLPSRIWWSPTGLLSVLPLHAAGSFGGESVLDRVVSSYAGSLRMFARGGLERPCRRVLVVAVPEAHGLPALRGVDDEVRAVGQATDATILRGPEATLSAVTAALAEHDVAHFACHATQSLVDPAESGIVLHDGKLGLAAIASVPGGAHLAFLSACRTGVGAVDLPDEALHVAASFQAAGFRHVVGTLWSVEDQSAAEFTAAVYARLSDGSGLDPARTAFAVHEATLEAREEDPYDPMRWAQWCHLGS